MLEAIINRPANDLAIFPFLDGAAFHQEDGARHAGHRRRKLPAIGFPVPVSELLLLKVFETFPNNLPLLFAEFIRKRRAGNTNGETEARKERPLPQESGHAAIAP